MSGQRSVFSCRLETSPRSHVYEPMRSPFSPLSLLVFIAAIAFLVAIVQFGVVTIALDKLGLSPSSAFLFIAGLARQQYD